MNRAKILIVEDEELLREIYKHILGSKGYDVYTASNGVEGIEQLKQNIPALVLLDMFMPVMDGKKFLTVIHTTDYPHTKFIVYTNLSDPAMEAEMLELGAHKVILKASMAPQDLIELAAEMTRE